MDEATTNIQRDMPLYMFFADDVVLVDESRVCRGRNPRGPDLVGPRPSICGAALVVLEVRWERLV
jgi:hypothetical protein